MKINKGIIIGVIILALYGLVMYFVVGGKSQSTNTNSNNNGNNNNNNNGSVSKEKYYFIVGNEKNYLYYNGKFSKTSKGNIESLSSMKVYIDNKYLGNYKMNYVATWNLFDENINIVTYKGDLLAFSNNLDAEVREFNVREINDDDKYELLSKYSINTFKYLTTNKVVDIDLDKNGIMDEVICLSSMEPSDNVNNYYNLVLLKYNNEFVTLVDERKDNATYVYDIYSIVNLLNSSNDYIIIKKIEGLISDDTKIDYSIIKYENDNYVID